MSKVFVSITFSIANFYVYVKKIVVAKFTEKNEYSYYNAQFSYSTTRDVLKVFKLINLAPAQISFWIGKIKWNDFYLNFIYVENAKKIDFIPNNV